MANANIGKGLNEQSSIKVMVDLNGVDNFQGSTSITGHGYMLYDGSHRKNHAAILMESFNIPDIMRSENGKWRQVMEVKFVLEDLRQEKNFVAFDKNNPENPKVVFEDYSDYLYRAINHLEANIENILKPLPIEKIYINKNLAGSEGHVIGTTIMGENKNKSVVNKYMQSHEVSNLIVLGSGAFPTSSPSNPTLTICALSLWAAKNLMKKGYAT